MDAATQARVRERANGQCEYCRLPDLFTTIPFHVEHVIAQVHQPKDSESNLAWACPHCNWNKGPNLSTLDPETKEKVDLFNPRVDHWSEHFAVKDYEIIGLTPTGRGTVELLKMNRPERIEVRRQVL
ncbi:MAG: HNH endonuclease signature motif containing protein [Lacipirellulaceae bacterium]